MSARFEVHEHALVSGARRGSLVHSHAGGDEPHQHEDTGPASFTIDRDEWFAATGLKGGGRKRFTPAPSGEQLPVVELADWQRTFEVIVHPSARRVAERSGEGGGMATALRMVLGHGLRPSVRSAPKGARV